MFMHILEIIKQHVIWALHSKLTQRYFWLFFSFSVLKTEGIISKYTHKITWSNFRILCKSHVNSPLMLCMSICLVSWIIQYYSINELLMKISLAYTHKHTYICVCVYICSYIDLQVEFYFTTYTLTLKINPVLFHGVLAPSCYWHPVYNLQSTVYVNRLHSSICHYFHTTWHSFHFSFLCGEYMCNINWERESQNKNCIHLPLLIYPDLNIFIVISSFMQQIR